MSTGDLLKALLPLILIIGLLYAALYFLKKYSFRGKGKESGILNIRVLSNKMIMPKKFISVVRVEDKLFVLAISENSITLLEEINSPNDSTIPSIHKEKESFLAALKKNIGMR
ncbi:flagellar biosynthesis protein FliO [bacterium BMS3Abin03]|nr:flagellar biosynthesis protein FliO [bacterium BMS3Abin03]